MTIPRAAKFVIGLFPLGNRALRTRRSAFATWARLSAFLILACALLPAAEAGRQTLVVPVTEPQTLTLTGDLFTPSGDGPFPAVILLHGCNGVGPNVTAWAVWLQSE